MKEGKKMKDLVLYFVLKYEGKFDEIYNALMKHEEVDENLKNKLFKNLNSNYVTIFDNDYPEKLKTINYPPFALFYKGNLNLVNNEITVLTGSYSPDDYGIRVTEKIATELIEKNHTIINGMATGVEKYALHRAINTNGKCIAVLGCGINHCYPKENEELYEEMSANQLILSEYPDYVLPNKRNLLFRNRIVAGLSNRAIVTEANMESSIMTMLGYEIEQGKDIFAVPTSILNENKGTNTLIENGAKPYLGIESIYGYEENNSLEL